MLSDQQNALILANCVEACVYHCCVWVAILQFPLALHALFLEIEENLKLKRLEGESSSYSL